MKRFFGEIFVAGLAEDSSRRNRKTRKGYPRESDEEKKYLFSKYLIKQKFAPCT